MAEPPPSWQRPEKVIKEIRKAGLTQDEATRLANLMQRFLEGRTFPKDHKVLREDVEELRLDGDRRIFRLYFSKTHEGFVLLALHFNGKKKDRDNDAVNLAAKRLRDWRTDR